MSRPDDSLGVSAGRSPSSAWTLALGVVIILLSSAAPFIRFGDGGISVSAGDVVNALLFTVAWLPFLVAFGLLLRLHVAQQLSGSPWLLALCILLLPIIAPAHSALYFAVDRSFNGSTDPSTEPIAFLVLTALGALQYLTVVALFVTDNAGRAAYKARITAADLQVSHARLQQELTESRLAILHAQLQPHFLFNTLNSVSALVTSNPTAARRMLIDLSALLRMVLDTHEHQLVSLQDEMEMVRAYLAIQHVRFGDRLTFDIDVDAHARQLAIPPMLLQPLVENAVHHAMTSDDSDVEVLVRSSVHGERLITEITNTGPVPVLDDGAVREGVGLRNTRLRLQQMFGSDFVFSLAPRSIGNGATARIEIPARPFTMDPRLPTRSVRS